jgi:hypothetical protein
MEWRPAFKMRILAKEARGGQNQRVALTNPRPESDPTQRSYLSGQMVRCDSDRFQGLQDALRNAVRAMYPVSSGNMKMVSSTSLQGERLP